MSRPTSPSRNSITPRLPKNTLGYTHRDYEGKASTLCAGCGTTPIIGRDHRGLLRARHRAAPGGEDLRHRLLVEDADYFLGQSHGFNSVHGRMPSVLTGANLANRDLIYLGVSGDGDCASIGLGQFAHAMRRGVNMVYIVENNGVYGLTKGQFSATADRGSKAKRGVDQHDTAHRPRRHGAAARRHLRGALASPATRRSSCRSSRPRSSTRARRSST